MTDAACTCVTCPVHAEAGTRREAVALRAYQREALRSEQLQQEHEQDMEFAARQRERRRRMHEETMAIQTAVDKQSRARTNEFLATLGIAPIDADAD